MLLAAASIGSPAAVHGQTDEPTVRIRVEIVGVQGELEDNIEAVLSIRQRRRDQLTGSEWRRLHQRAPGEIEVALQPFGFYRPTIDAQLIENGNRWTARYIVEAGPAMLLDRVDVRLEGDGASDSAFAALVTAFPLGPGDTVRHQAYEDGKRALSTYAGTRGYFDAVFDTAQIRVDLVQYSADIIIHLRTGPRYKFGEITVHQDVLNPGLLKGRVDIQPGEPFDAVRLRVVQEALGDGPWFSRVDVEVHPESAVDLEVPIDMELVPSRRQRFEIGVGYGTDTGFRAKFGYVLRRINRHGHFANGDIQYSQRESSLSLRYNIPRPYPSTAMYSGFAGYGLIRPDWSRSNLAILGADVAVSFASWRNVISLAWEGESFTVADQEGTSSLFIPTISFTRVRSDDALFATHGSSIRLDMLFASESLGSTTSFLTLVGIGKIVRSPGEKWRLLGRTQVGYTATSEFFELPATHRFVTGGDNTVRGYAFQSLGPLNESGQIVGGDLLIVASVEADYFFKEKWGIAAFVDAGNGLFADRRIELEVGAGLGARWASPVGLVRIDLGYPITIPDRNLRLHLIIGPDL